MCRFKHNIKSAVARRRQVCYSNILRPSDRLGQHSRSFYSKHATKVVIFSSDADAQMCVGCDMIGPYHIDPATGKPVLNKDQTVVGASGYAHYKAEEFDAKSGAVKWASSSQQVGCVYTERDTTAEGTPGLHPLLKFHAAPFGPGVFIQLSVAEASAALKDHAAALESGVAVRQEEVKAMLVRPKIVEDFSRSRPSKYKEVFRAYAQTQAPTGSIVAEHYCSIPLMHQSANAVAPNGGRENGAGPNGIGLNGADHGVGQNGAGQNKLHHTSSELEWSERDVQAHARDSVGSGSITVAEHYFSKLSSQWSGVDPECGAPQNAENQNSSGLIRAGQKWCLPPDSPKLLPRQSFQAQSSVASTDDLLPVLHKRQALDNQKPELEAHLPMKPMYALHSVNRAIQRDDLVDDLEPFFTGDTRPLEGSFLWV